MWSEHERIGTGVSTQFNVPRRARKFPESILKEESPDSWITLDRVDKV